MELYLVIGLSFVVSTLVILFFVKTWLNTLSHKSEVTPELLSMMQDLGRRVDVSGQNVDSKLTATIGQFNTRLDRASEVIGNVQKSIGEFSEIGRGMKELQDLLRSPKLRGNIGEAVLADLLAQVLPHETYALQYAFASGEKVDAILKISGGLVPVDAKFPFENFRKYVSTSIEVEQVKFRKDFMQDVKKHITDISKKYILPAEDTVDYALMYVPAEAVYYEVIRQEELYDFMVEKRVIPVSPLSFYAYLRAILVSYEGQRVQSQAKEILATLQAMRGDYSRLEEEITLMTKHLSNAYNKIDDVERVFGKLGSKLDSARGLSLPEGLN